MCLYFAIGKDINHISQIKSKLKKEQIKHISLNVTKTEQAKKLEGKNEFGEIPKGWECFGLIFSAPRNIFILRQDFKLKQSHFVIAYAIVAPHSSHGCDPFDGTSAVWLWGADESTIFGWTIGVFVESVVIDGKMDLCTVSDASEIGFFFYNNVNLLSNQIKCAFWQLRRRHKLKSLKMLWNKIIPANSSFRQICWDCCCCCICTCCCCPQYGFGVFVREETALYEPIAWLAVQKKCDDAKIAWMDKKALRSFGWKRGNER